MTRFEKIIKLVQAEYKRAANKFPPFHSAHEGYAILEEEVDELWDAIKTNDEDAAFDEVIQVAAMAVRFLYDVRHGLTWDEQMNKALEKIEREENGSKETNHTKTTEIGSIGQATESTKGESGDGSDGSTGEEL